MSTNNLASQLAWLLDAKPFIPPPYAFQAVLESIATPAATQQLDGHSSNIPGQSETRAAAVQEPDLLSTEHQYDPQESHMARLRAAASPSRKPRLVSQAATPTPALPIDASLRNIHDDQDRKRRTTDEIRRRFPPTQDFHAKLPTSQSQPDFACPPSKPTFSGTPKPLITTIDLTGDSGIGLATSERWSPPVQDKPIGRDVSDDSTLQAGRKRKSEEYEQDLHHDHSSTHSMAPARRSPIQETDESSSSKRLNADAQPDTPIQQSRQIQNAQHVPAKAIKSLGYSRYYSESSQSQNSSAINGELIEPQPRIGSSLDNATTKSVTSIQRRAHHRSRSPSPIADSEDEVDFIDDMPDESGVHEDTYNVDRPAVNDENLNLISAEQELSQASKADLNGIKSSLRSPSMKTGQPMPAFLNSPPQDQVGLQDGSDLGKESMITASDSNELAKSFSKWTTEALCCILNNYELSETNAWDQYVNAVANADEQDTELEEIHKNAKAQADSLRVLMKSRQNYSALTQSRESVKTQFRELYNSGNDHDIKAKLKAELQELTKSWRNIENELISNIKVLTEKDMLPRNTNQFTSPIAVPSTQKAKVKDAATQTDSESPSFAAQFVRQTQFPQDWTYQSRAITEESDNFGEDEDLFSNGMEPRENVDPDNELPTYFGDAQDDLAKSHRNYGDNSQRVFQELSHNANRGISLQAREYSNGHENPTKSSIEPLSHQHRWTRDVRHGLKYSFGLQGFRPNQLDAINATLSGKDVFVLMPTGGGKSLCYQLPAIIGSGATKGVTVVVSPLLSLMEDQVAHLKRLQIQAVLLNGECSRENRKVVMDALRSPNVESLIQLLYVTPEMLSKSQAVVNTLSKLHERNKLARIVIDEAHCVSQWGHDFRPDYKELGQIRNQFGGIPVMALTATATENVKVDVINNLNIRGCKVFTQSFNRPNLTYEVIPKKAKTCLAEMAEMIKDKYDNRAGIIYCLSRKKCEDIAESLRGEYGIKAYHYHAQVDPLEKRDIQAKWQSGVYQVIVATIAFGMGIDKADVRFVIHHSLPKSLEGYYQETGRAGRDGERSGCYLYYNYQDSIILRQMIKNGDADNEQKDRQNEMLRKVVAFCENKADCRRVQVLRYFSEDFPREKCNASCDNCNSTSTFVMKDFTEHAKNAIEVVRQTGRSKVTLLQCVDILRGSKVKKITENGWDQLDQHGSASDLDRNDLERIFYRLLGENALEEYNTTNKMKYTAQYIKLGPNSKSFSQGRQSIKIQVKAPPSVKGQTTSDNSNGQNKRSGANARQKPMPPPTYLSSPPRGGQDPRHAPRGQITEQAEDDSSVEPIRKSKLNGYERDGGFCVSDAPFGNQDGAESDDAFEPIMAVDRRRRKRSNSLSDPITSDEMMAGLTELHKEIVEDFVSEAKKECKKIQQNKSLRALPFTDTSLRSMAITFPEDLESLLDMPGVDANKVDAYGKRFLKLIAKYRDKYERLKHSNHDKPLDPNHELIDLVDDEDDEESDKKTEDDDDLLDSGFDEDDFREMADCGPSPQQETSAYFAGNRRNNKQVNEFNARLQELGVYNQEQSRPARPRDATPTKARRASKSTWNGKEKKRGGGNRNNKYRGAPRRGGAGINHAGIGKRMSSSKKPAGPRRRTTDEQGRPPAQGGIGMMPT